MNERAIAEETTSFAIFRARDADPGMTMMSQEPATPVEQEGGRRMMEAGVHDGHDVKVLFSTGGFSLTYAWFKSGYPLPRHTHNVDCLYYIVSGSIRMGKEELGAGDGFFIGADVPYTYTPGPAGVEILEFRAANMFNIKVMANNPAYWERALEAVKEHRPAWATEQKPSLVGA